MNALFPTLVAAALLAPALPSQSPRAIRVPLSFETGRASDHLARGPGYTARVHDRGAEIVWLRGEANEPGRAALDFPGARPVPPRARGALPGRSHYLIGDDPAAWRRGVVHHRELVQEDVWPGIDLVWHGDPTRLEYDFLVAPGADPERIRIRWRGLGGDGVHQREPVAWEETPAGRRPVRVRLEARGGGVSGFALDGWSGRHPLVIDPVVAYGTFLGGAGNEAVSALARDAGGNLYLAGSTASASFLYGGTGTRKGLWDLFVVKLDPTGTQALYTTFVGGTDAYGEAESALDLAVDGQGRAVVLGRTEVGDFPTVNAFQPAFGGAVDAVVFALDPSGANLAYSTYLGGSGFDVDRDVLSGNGGLVVDGADHVYVSAQTWSADFPTVNASQPAPGGSSDLFVVRFDPTGQPAWSTYLGGTGHDSFNDLEWSPLGFPVLAGGSTGGPWPTTPGAAYATGVGFVTALDAASQAVLWSTRFPLAPLGIAVDLQGDTWLVGSTSGGDVPTTPGSHMPRHGGSYQSHVHQAWIARVDTFGTALRFATYYGGPSSNEAFGDVVVDVHGHATAVGARSSHWTTLDSDGLVVKFDPLGFAVVYDIEVGGSDSGVGGAVLERPGSVWVAGGTWDPLAIATAGALQGQSGGQQDGFLARIEDDASTVAVVATAADRISGGTRQVFEVVLDGVAPSGGMPVTLTSSDPAALQVPAAVTVPAGSASAVFTAVAGQVPDTRPVTVTASGPGTPQSLAVVVWPGPRWIVESFRGSQKSSGLAVNAHGHIAGTSASGGFVVDDGGFRIVTSGDVMALNDRGDVAGRTGFYGTAFHQPAGGSQVVLGPLQPGGANSWASGLNAFGQVVGGGDYVYPGGTYGQQAFRWSSATGFQLLGHLGGEMSEARGVNRAGQVTGSSQIPGATHAFRYTDGPGMVDLGVPAGYTHAYGNGINDLGQVTGGVFTSSYTASAVFRYTDGLGMQVLTPPQGMTHGAGLDIDTAGRVVGWLGTSRNPTSGAALHDGGWRLLEEELSSEDAFRWDLARVHGLDDRGELVGTGFDQEAGGASERAFRLTPAFFVPYGRGSEGTRRIVTALRGEGTPVSGRPVTFTVRGAPHAMALVAASPTRAQVPLPGGAQLSIGLQSWTSPLLVLDGRGLAGTTVTLPPGMAPGSVFLQAATLDPRSANGVFTTSNGIEMRVPY